MSPDSLRIRPTAPTSCPDECIVDERVPDIVPGEHESFERIVAEYDTVIFNLAFRMASDYEDARDITQTVFMKAFRAFDTFDPSRRVFSWLYRIAVNESINHIKRRKRTSNLDRDVTDHRPNPEEQFAQDQKSRLLQAALDRLGLDLKVVIILKYFVDLPYREIATVLEIPEKTVKSRLYSARQQLKDVLEQQRHTA